MEELNGKIVTILDHLERYSVLWDNCFISVIGKETLFESIIVDN